jgi:oligosaccharyltransferase complex subunit alpha (ribophorin I)
MDFSITKVTHTPSLKQHVVTISCFQDEASESRMRVASLIEQVQTVQDRRSALYQSYEDAINKYKTSKDANLFTNNRKRIDGDHKALTSQISTLQAKLKTEGAAEPVEKVTIPLHIL